jgi:hypothetical protein
MRGPKEAAVGKLRRIMISDITVYNADPKNGCIISGDSAQYIEDVRLSNIRIYYSGGGTAEQALREVPGFRNEYPEPARFGVLPSYGFFVRHVKDIQFNNVQVSLIKEDQRPAFYLDDVDKVDLNFVKAQKIKGVPFISCRNVMYLTLFRSLNHKDKKISKIKKKQF